MINHYSSKCAVQFERNEFCHVDRTVFMITAAFFLGTNLQYTGEKLFLGSANLYGNHVQPFT